MNNTAILSAWPAWLQLNGGGRNITVDGGPVRKCIAVDTPESIEYERETNAPKTMQIRVLVKDVSPIEADTKITIDGKRVFAVDTPRKDPSGTIWTFQASETQTFSTGY